jgi:hypothetical protein
MSDSIEFNLPLPVPPPPLVSAPLVSEPLVSAPLVPGKFDYIRETSYKARLVNAFQAITQTETWHFVAKPCESFMSSEDPLIWVITNKMEELGYNCHSGSSFGCTMRDMQYIAQNGEQAFKDVYLRQR